MYCGNLESFEIIDRMELISKGYFIKNWKKISYNKKESFLKSIFLKKKKNTVLPKAFSSREGTLSAVYLFYEDLCEKVYELCPHFLFYCWIKGPRCLCIFTFEFADDWKLTNQGQTDWVDHTRSTIAWRIWKQYWPHLLALIHRSSDAV